MAALTALLIPIIIFAVGALIVLALVERFSPDATITYVVKLVILGIAIIFILTKILPVIIH